MGSRPSPPESQYRDGMTESDHCGRPNMRSLIELYRGSPCLWDRRHRGYRDRGQRERAYEQLTERFRAEYPEANVHFVKARIKNMLDTFRREIRRVDESKRRARGAEDVHRPRLWYFDLLQFAADSVRFGRCRQRINKCRCRDGEATGSRDDAQATTSTRDDAHSAEESDDSVLELYASDENEEMRDDTKASDANKVPVEQEKSLSLDEEYRAYGVVVGSKLRRMDPDQRIICELIINEAISRGLRNQLTPTSPTVAGNSEPLNVPYSNNFQGPCCYPNENHQNFPGTWPIMPPQNPTIRKNKK